MDENAAKQEFDNRTGAILDKKLPGWILSGLVAVFWGALAWFGGLLVMYLTAVIVALALLSRHWAGRPPWIGSWGPRVLVHGIVAFVVASFVTAHRQPPAVVQTPQTAQVRDGEESKALLEIRDEMKRSTKREADAKAKADSTAESARKEAARVRALESARHKALSPWIAEAESLRIRCIRQCGDQGQAAQVGADVEDWRARVAPFMQRRFDPSYRPSAIGEAFPKPGMSRERFEIRPACQDLYWEIETDLRRLRSYL